MARRILEGGLLLDPASGRAEPGTVVIADGEIEAVAWPGDGPVAKQASDRVEDLSGRWLAPGLVDLRASLGEPGFEQRETVASGLAAAAAGGFSAVCATPDTSPVVDREAVVGQLLTLAARAGGARLLPVGAATQGLGGEAIAPYGELVDAGCVAVSQGEGLVPRAQLMRRVLEYASAFEIPVMVTAVEPTLGAGMCHEGLWSTRLGLPGNPVAAELVAVQRDLAIAELTGGRLHLSRITTAAALRAVREAKGRGVAVTCDVTPHHLHLTVEALAAYDANFKVWPPLRAPEDVEALRTGLADGTVDAVATDHRPLHYEDKNRELVDASPGVVGLETALPLVLRLVTAGTLTPLQAVGALSLGPSRVLGLDGGALRAGAPADLVVIDPKASWIVDAAALKTRSRNTPWIGKVMLGRATATLVGGDVVFEAEGADA